MSNNNSEDTNNYPVKHENRNSDGTFKKGYSGNLNGSFKKGQRYGIRVEYWREKLTLRELRALHNDHDRMDELSVTDAQIIKHLVNTLTGPDVRAEREAMLNRIEGRPMQIIEQRIGPLPASLSKDYDNTKIAEQNYAEQMTAAYDPSPFIDMDEESSDDGTAEVSS